MKPLPTDPLTFQARVFSALCDDLFDIASGKSRSCERTNAIRQISRQTSTREAGVAKNAPASNQNGD